MKAHFLLLLLLYVPLSAQCVFAQDAISDSAFRAAQVNNAIALYKNFRGPNARLYNGSQFIPYQQKATGNQFFKSDSWHKGTVFYDGEWYEDIPMLYDILNDQLIILGHDRVSHILLISERIDSFGLWDHTFIHYIRDSAQTNNLRTGFYDRLYNGNITVLAKRTKNPQETHSMGEISHKFIEKERYYIRKGNAYYPVGRRRKSVLAVFKDEKHELKKYLRKHKIRFRRSPDFAIVKMAEYYDQLKQQP